MEILPRHEPIMTPLAIAPLAITLSGNAEPVFYALMGGFLDHDGHKAMILADGAESGSEIDMERARQAMYRARERLDEVTRRGEVAEQMIDADRAQLALLRSLTRMQAADHSAGKS